MASIRETTVSSKTSKWGRFFRNGVGQGYMLYEEAMPGGKGALLRGKE